MDLRPRLRRRLQPKRWSGVPLGERVLIEHPDDHVRGILESALREHGYQVSVCPGPPVGDSTPRCPVVLGQPCAAVESADVIVSGLDPTDSQHRDIVTTIQANRPELPVVADIPQRIPRTATNHRVYRTTIAPLVRQLHDLLASAKR
jgi:hypothetical protein